MALHWRAAVPRDCGADVKSRTGKKKKKKATSTLALATNRKWGIKDSFDFVALPSKTIRGRKVSSERSRKKTQHLTNQLNQSMNKSISIQAHDPTVKSKVLRACLVTLGERTKRSFPR